MGRITCVVEEMEQVEDELSQLSPPSSPFTSPTSKPLADPSSSSSLADLSVISSSTYTCEKPSNITGFPQMSCLLSIFIQDNKCIKERLHSVHTFAEEINDIVLSCH